MKRRNKTSSRRTKKSGHEKKWRSALAGVPKDAPSLIQADRLTQKASRAGFDWPNIDGVFAKLDEELRELKEALVLQDRRKVQEEVGDLLFVAANVSRFLRVDPEKALKKTLRKFMSRFHYIEITLQREGRTLRQSNLKEMDRLWEESKN